MLQMRDDGQADLGVWRCGCAGGMDLRAAMLASASCVCVQVRHNRHMNLGVVESGIDPREMRQVFQALILQLLHDVLTF